MVEKLKTGTTCIGLVFKDGVMLAADRRATGSGVTTGLVKIFDISKNILATMAGHAADCQLVMRVIQGELKLLELKNERTVRVQEAAMILNSMQYSGIRTQGSIVSLIVGGFDKSVGFSLYNLSPDGTILPHEGYVVDGSGSIFIKGTFDNEYRPDLSEEEALALVEKAFKTSFKNDTASGNGFIARIATKDGIKEVKRTITETRFVESVK